VVDVPDERLPVLGRLERSRKIVPAKVRFVDVPGGLTARGIAEYREVDALCIVVRAFGPDPDPRKELDEISTELLVTDLAGVEGALQRARRRARSSREAPVELDALERAHAVLDSERLLREGDLDETTRRALRGYGLLTLKPWIVVANVEEGMEDAWSDEVLVLSAALEAEVAGMEAEEAAELLAGFGVKRPGLDRVIEACYRALDLITFLTTGEDESRAWELRRGATAPQAAGVIHSDLERGFIRAEVISYAELVEAGSWAAAKAAGRLRLEGKTYGVREGDVLNIRFAV
jgi:ribosome-binding ATPase